MRYNLRYFVVTLLLLITALFSARPFAVRAATYVVTNLNDSGAGSLRQAITDANANPGPDTITFAVAGTINIFNQNIQLPNISDTSGGTIIDGTTAPGYAGVPVVTLKGPDRGILSGSGLTITSANNQILALQIVSFVFGININGAAAAGNSIVGNYIGTDGTLTIGNFGYGVSINNAPGNIVGGAIPSARNVISGNSVGVVITGASASGNIVQGNFIGTNATGTLKIPNNIGVWINESSGNLVGGTTPEARNIISGNNNDGLRILAATATGNSVQGNFIGTDVTGTLALANTVDGIDIIDAPNNIIGGTIPSARNVISGNGSVGVAIFGLLASGNVVQGNFIGTDATGTLPIPNILHGVQLAAPGNLVGGTTPAARNIISGNRDVGVQIGSANGNGNSVQGNFIGTDVTGSLALGNGGAGVFINTGSSNTIGGLDAGSQNVISGNLSGNAGSGIVILNASGNIIQGNLIGTDVTGTTGLPNQMGILVNYPNNGTNTTIGGTTAAARNIISANHNDGIRITSINAFTTGDVVQGNYIGTDISGTLDLGNTWDGVFIETVSGVLVGGDTLAAGNLIAFNRRGVAVNNAGVPVNNNTILHNSMHANDFIGIDLPQFFVANANDPGDGDDGANGLQNFPVITSAIASSTETLVAGSLNSTASSTFTLEFFSNSVCSPIGHGEGETFLGSTTIATNALGDANFNLTFLSSVPAGHFITATATGPLGNTSEYSRCVAVILSNQPPVVEATLAAVTVDEGQTASNDGTVSDLDGDAVTLSASVGSITNNGTGTWSWSYSTDDGPTQSAIVTISADDGHGGTSQTTFNLTVNNIAPTVNAGPDDFITSGSAFSVNATFTDPSVADTHTATINYGMGAGPQPATVVQGAGSGTVSGSETYFLTITYTITVCVTDDDGGSGCDSLFLVVSPLLRQVTIDIKPNSPHNRINLKSLGKLPVAILSSATFDATQVDPRSVRLAGAPVFIKPNGKPSAQFKDVNDDGRLDLVLRVRIQDLQLTETSTEAILIAMTFGGQAIQGKDKVSIVQAHGPELEAPRNGSVQTKRTFKLKWEWKDQEDEDEDVTTCFLVQIDNQSDFSSPEQSSVVVREQSYTTAPLKNGVYYWRVAVSDCASAVITPWSETWSFTVRVR